MINGIKKETIVSTTEDRLTLLNWLKKLEKTLSDYDAPTDIAFTDDGGNVSLALTFEDGTTKSVTFPYDMSAFAKKSEVTSGLALKANVSGQAFTGAITAPSIIEDMVGYSKDKPDMPDFTTLYMGAVKNGNKLTLVWFISLTATQTGYSGEILPGIRVPKSLDSALVPFSLSGLDNLLDNKTVPLYSAYNQKVDSTMMIQKYTTSLYLNIQPRIYVSGLTVNTTYLFRIEETFLLSDNLAS